MKNGRNFRKLAFTAALASATAMAATAFAQNGGWGSGVGQPASQNSGKSISSRELIASLAEPEGGTSGNLIDIYIPPNAHLSEIIIYYDESPDRVNGIMLYYQPDLDSRPVSANYVGQLKGKSFRIPVGWHDVITGLTTQTNARGNLVAFKLNTIKGERGYGSSEKVGEQTKSFGDGLLFAGLTARADKKRVYGLGIRTVPAEQAPRRASYNAKVMAQPQRVAVTPVPRPEPKRTKKKKIVVLKQAPKKSGLAKALEDFGKAVEQGKRDREFDAQQKRLRKQQQDINNARARQQAAKIAADRRKQQATPRPAVPSRPAKPTPAKPIPAKPTQAKLTNKSGTTMSASLLRLGGNSQAILYSRCNYQGKAIGIYNGDWTVARLKQLGFESGGLNSIKLMPNKQITLKTQATSRVITKNTACLRYPVHARPAFTSFKVGTRSAVAAGQKFPTGVKPRDPEEMQWTPQGVTGMNVGAVYLERKDKGTDGGASTTSIHRLIIAEEGSQKWRWFSPGYKKGKVSLGEYTVLNRSKNSLYLASTNLNKGLHTHRFHIDLRNNTASYQQRKSLTSDKPEDRDLFGVVWTARVSIKSRPR